MSETVSQLVPVFREALFGVGFLAGIVIGLLACILWKLR